MNALTSCKGLVESDFNFILVHWAYCQKAEQDFEKIKAHL